MSSEHELHECKLYSGSIRTDCKANQIIFGSDGLPNCHWVQLVAARSLIFYAFGQGRRGRAVPARYAPHLPGVARALGSDQAALQGSGSGCTASSQKESIRLQPIR